jgi:hypothetical protein
LADDKKGKNQSKKEGISMAKVSGKAIITPDIRKNWIRVRQAWNSSVEAFTGTLSMLNNAQANALYDVVKLSLFQGSHAEILRNHPEMRELIKSDDDRFCMHDIYDALSRRLDRREPFPSYVAMKQRMMGPSVRMEDL